MTSLILVVISVLNRFSKQNYLLSSNFDFSSNSYPNHLIFDCVDSILSYLS